MTKREAQTKRVGALNKLKGGQELVRAANELIHGGCGPGNGLGGWLVVYTHVSDRKCWFYVTGQQCLSEIRHKMCGKRARECEAKSHFLSKSSVSI